MSPRNLVEIIVQYWSSADPKLLDIIVERLGRFVPYALPPKIRENPDLLSLVNRRIASRLRNRDADRTASVEDLRKLIGQTALQVLQEARRKSQRWRIVSRYFRFGRLRDAADRQEAESAFRFLDWVRGELTDDDQIRVFDLMREGLNSREISAKIGAGFSEQTVWIIKKQIRELIRKRIQDEFDQVKIQY